MAIRNIRIIGDEILEKKCRPVTEMKPRIKELIEDMLDTMYDAQGVGLAAPQVTYIMHDLKEKGLPVKVNVTTVKEATDEIMRALEKKI